MKVGQVYSGNYLKAEDLQGKTVRVTIKKVTVQEFEKRNGTMEKKFVLAFQGKDKLFVANKTNAAIIAENVGTDESDNWPGQTITLCTKKVEYGGGLVLAIRVVLDENPSPQQAAPATRAPAPPPDIEPEDEDPSGVPF